MLLSEKGFSLIEVLVSLTILSVSVIGISQFFSQANQISAENNSKLVATNLARMTLERIQLDYESFKITSDPKTYDKSVCTSENCRGLYETMINNRPYEINVDVMDQVGEEASLNPFPIKVIVQYEMNEKIKTTSVEGYVKDAN